MTIRYRILRHRRDRCLLPCPPNYWLGHGKWSGAYRGRPQPWHSEAANGP